MPAKKATSKASGGAKPSSKTAGGAKPAKKTAKKAAASKRTGGEGNQEGDHPPGVNTNEGKVWQDAVESNTRVNEEVSECLCS